ncbi:hypothetical protein A9Q81_22390 [Gammaproteobacteria bacterium 42_54_T18]|nr:hypothetical protein A9Q81_22390 [Gammaproteobacteria bacterium 42_54_T18]
MSEILPKILIVEGSPSLARCYEAYLAQEGCETIIAKDGQVALTIMEGVVPEVVLLDFKLQEVEGLEIINRAKELNLPCVFIVMTTHGSENVADESMRSGALGFLEKPFTRDRLVITVKNALDRQRIESVVEKDQKFICPKEDIKGGKYYGFIGSSNEMQSVYRTIEAAAESKATVFITGESGTGKEVCAQAVHQKSNRSKKEFVAINCAAIPRDLMESEIFGHVKGAFTGAQSTRQGAASKADGGTLFLDEIGEMDLDLQSKLLRFIQTGTIQKVGSSTLESVDVRFVCATNRAPLEQVKQGQFREDLYYRLHVIPITLPPLREREDDVLVIANNFLRKFSKEEEKGFKKFSPETEAIISKYDWPGNIRQLQNVVRNIIVLNNGTEVVQPMLPPPLDKISVFEESESVDLVDGLEPYIVPESIPEAAFLSQPGIVPPEETHDVRPLRRVEREKSVVLGVIKQMLHDKKDGPNYRDKSDIKELWKVEMEAIEDAITLCDNNIPTAAKCLGVSPSTIYRKVQSWKNNGLL